MLVVEWVVAQKIPHVEGLSSAKIMRCGCPWGTPLTLAIEHPMHDFLLGCHPEWAYYS